MLIILTALTPTADALSCMYGPGEPFPRDAAVDVPIDVVPRVSLYGIQEVGDLVLIEESSGQVVASEIEVVLNPGDVHMAWLRPQASLLPQTKYSLLASVVDDASEPWQLATFTTGDAASSEEPEVPAVLSIRRDRGKDIWGSWNWLDIEVSAAAPATYRVQVAGNDQFSDYREVDVISYAEDFSTFSVGSGVCGGSLELEAGESVVRVAAVDYAGVASEFTPTQSAGCSTLTGRGSLPAAIFSFLALFRLRQRRATPQS